VGIARRLFLLNGLGILAVVCNHAVGWGFTAMFWWTDRYRAVVVPNFDQLGTPAYYALVAIEKLAVFSVPTFLLTSGFFIAYAARGSQSTLTWRTVLTRVKALLVPYLVWSTVILVGDLLQGITYGPTEYLRKLVCGEAVAPYFYVPLLCQLILLSPLLVPMARTRPRELLLISVVVLLGVLGVQYLVFYRELSGADMPVVNRMEVLLPPCAFVRLMFFFVLGMVAGFYVQQFTRVLHRLKRVLVPATAIFGLLAIVESEAMYRLGGVDLRGSPLTIFSSLYAVTFVMAFLAFDEISIPFSTIVNRFGKATYGVYLLHPIVLEFAARSMQKFTPWILAYPIAFVTVLVILAAGGPLIVMEWTAKSRVRRYYRYLFG